MQVSVEEISPLTRKMKIILPEDLVGKKLEQAYRKLQAEVHIKGFRKGKVPRKILEKNYGAKVEYDLSEELVKESYFDALQESKLDVVVHPDIKDHKFEDDGTFSYVAEIDIKPQIELGEYKNMEVELPELVVSDDEILAEIERLRKEMAPLRNVEDRGARENDLAVIDYQAYHEGKEVKQVVGRDYTVDIGSGNNGKDFENACVGLKIGEETSKEITFPANFPNPVLAGKNIGFKITVKNIKERVLADLDDDFAQDIGEEFNTLDDLKKHLHDKLLQKKEDARSGDLSDQIMRKLLKTHEFEVPARLIQYEINHYLEEIGQSLKKRGLSMEEAGMNIETLSEQYRETADKRVRGDFILKKIAEVEGIKLKDSDLKEGFERISEQYGMPIDEVKKYFANRDDLLPLMNELHVEKILEFLRSNAKINHTTPAATDNAGDVEGEGEN